MYLVILRVRLLLFCAIILFLSHLPDQRHVSLFIIFLYFYHTNTSIFRMVVSVGVGVYICLEVSLDDRQFIDEPILSVIVNDHTILRHDLSK